jgi:hypothetical protein
LTVNKGSIGCSVSSSLVAPQHGKSVTLTATISGTGATGTVTFKDGETLLGTSTLSNGVATYDTSDLSVGTHSITAVYSGDANFASSTSSAITLTVTKAGGVNWGLIGGIIAAVIVGLFLLFLLLFSRRGKNKPDQQAQA